MASDTGLSSSSRSLSVDSIVDGMGSGERHTLRTNCSPFVFRNQMAGIPCQGEAQIPASDSTRRYLRTKKEKLGHLLSSV